MAGSFHIFTFRMFLLNVCLSLHNVGGVGGVMTTCGLKAVVDSYQVANCDDSVKKRITIRIVKNTAFNNCYHLSFMVTITKYQKA